MLLTDIRPVELVPLLGIFGGRTDVFHPRKLILYTDARPGDAAGLLGLLMSPYHEVLGIVAGGSRVPLAETEKHLLQLLELAGKPDIPVFSGAAWPLGGGRPEDRMAPVMDGMEDAQLPEPAIRARRQDGANTVLNTLRDLPPGERVTLVCTGGLTDLFMSLQLLLPRENPLGIRGGDFLSTLLLGKEKARGLINGIEAIYVAGGVFDPALADAPQGEHSYTEGNMLFDPRATASFLEIVEWFHIPVFMAPLDLTAGLAPGAEQAGEWRKAKGRVTDMMADFLVRQGPEALRDATPALALLRPDLFQARAARVRAEGTHDSLPGRTWIERPKGYVHLLDVPPARREEAAKAYLDMLRPYRLLDWTLTQEAKREERGNGYGMDEGAGQTR